MLDFMLQRGPQYFITESYVCVPPANHIIDEQNAIWMLGLHSVDRRERTRGHYTFNVLRNGQETGEIASHIERRYNKVRILTRVGWKYWNGQHFA